MKKAAIIKNSNQAKDIMKLVDSFILPLKNFSTNYGSSFTISEIKEIVMLKKEIFVSVNKNIHENELEDLKKALLEIDQLNIKGILFYDIAVVNLKNKLNLKTDLVWAAEHLTTNYQTINYWHDKGVNYAYLSSELTKEEIDEICEKTKSKLFLNIFGYLPMFTSKRNLVKNYLEYFDLKNNDEKKIYKEEKYYPIDDTKQGTTVYSNYILNAFDLNFQVDYLVYNSYLIDDKDFKKVLLGDNGFSKEYGFLFQETVYKVKNNE